MDHDFGAPQAVATIFELVRAGHTALDENDLEAAASIARTVDELTGALGLVATAAHDGDDAGEIDDLVARRQAAREAEDFAEADRIRDELHERGIEVEDTAAGPGQSRCQTGPPARCPEALRSRRGPVAPPTRGRRRAPRRRRADAARC